MRRIKVPYPWCGDRVYVLQTTVKQKQSPCKKTCSAVVLRDWGPGIRREAAASALIYCNPGMIVQISNRARSAASQAHLLLGQGWPEPGPSATGRGTNQRVWGSFQCSLWKWGRAFLSEIWEKCVSREPCCQAAGQEDEKPPRSSVSGGMPRGFPQAPLSLSQPPPWGAAAGDAAPLPFAGAQLRASPVPGACQFLPGPSCTSFFCRGLLARAHPPPAFNYSRFPVALVSLMWAM